ncbi:MAG TPA: heparan-alpha-glucosaminide N-acetyltransferase domain-containing protein, partial [Polyangia bacterium]
MQRSPEAEPPSPPARPGRIEVVDWLRGVAVALMILAHGFDAWLLPAAKSGFPYEVIKLLSGIPARLFLFLVGVSAAIQFETALRQDKSMSALRHTLIRRGLLVILLAYLFRLQEWLLSAFYGGWQSLVRVDILNAIGLSLVVVATVGTPRHGRRQILPCLVVAAILLGLGTVIGPAHFPAWLPAPLTSYLGGQRPMSWFPLFPWGAWALVGVAVGHWWLTGNRSEQGLRRVILLGGAVGLGLVAGVHIIRAIAPNIISYPSKVVFQMGPGVFLHRLGLIGMLALLGFFWCR